MLTRSGCHFSKENIANISFFLSTNLNSTHFIFFRLNNNILTKNFFTFFMFKII